jgi:molybdopterin converting factor small subunit
MAVKVTVKLFATFRTGRFEAAEREYPVGTTVAQIVDELRIPREEIGILMVSGRHSDLTREIAAGETVAIFPLVGGG